MKFKATHLNRLDDVTHLEVYHWLANHIRKIHNFNTQHVLFIIVNYTNEEITTHNVLPMCTVRKNFKFITQFEATHQMNLRWDLFPL